ncbi:MAG TPA: cation:proton antiporter [Hyphomicrobium sp.]|jgi:CPA2 family monovalent cation:H+ antiporter-2|uniref:cation:proton antiporter domain-containing protein n=1 Tax=Hyphomicrobium sp. TaxID=82 RepID=UPI002BF7F0D8|nr:cation:proton antiporter [Hyphomicrobium sp.]HXE02756.1 cation:proton antiporter [Hyphomicrobium sp.]
MTAAGDLATYKDALLVLGTAGVVVPLLHRYGVSTVLAFLLTGAFLSPGGLGALTGYIPSLSWLTITDPERLAKFAEWGVVFLLFLIGLELSFERLSTMRRLVFGLGGSQVLLSAALIGLIAYGLGQRPVTAIVIGAALCLSSTAIVIELLASQKRLSTSVGRTSFSILLFQDLAVVPILLLLSILEPDSKVPLVVGIATALVQATAALLIIVGVGRFLLQPLFRLVAQTGNDDLFIAATMFVAVGTSFVTAAAGLSMALGAFVAGLLLAETEYRRAVQTTIEPIKSLLLGVFFFSIGSSLDLKSLFSDPFDILATTGGLIVLQVGVIYGLARLFGVARPASIETATLLAPCGEFAFVILTVALGYGLIERELTVVLLTSVSLTMALIPATAKFGRWLARRNTPPAAVDPALALMPSDTNVKALVVGYGRVGQLIGEMLAQHNVSYIAVDREPRLVANARRDGKPVYFGDVRQLDFLRNCGLDTAKAAILTIRTQSEIDAIVQALRTSYPKLVIVARAKDANHARHLYEIGVTDAVPETIEASLQLSEAALVGLGIPTGLVIASIHEKRDVFRNDLQGAARKAGTETRALPSRKRL